jgi:hypothetical protein
LELSARDADLLLTQEVGLAIFHATQVPPLELARAAHVLAAAR